METWESFSAEYIPISPDNSLIISEVELLMVSYKIWPCGYKTFFMLSSAGPVVIKLFSCSAQLKLKFILLINVKMPTIVGIFTFISGINYRLY